MPADKAPAKRKTGRPTTFTQELANQICARMSQGETVTKILEAAGMPADLSVVWYWRNNNPAFATAYARAREEQMHAWADQIITEAEDGTGDYVVGADGKRKYQRHNMDRTRLIVDTKKWLMARLAPKDFGDKQTVDLNHGMQGKDDAELWAEFRRLAENLGLPIPEHLLPNLMKNAE